MPTETSTFRVLVIAGGDSPEREVSLLSGRSVANALAADGHSVALFDPADQAVGSIVRADWDLAFPMLHGTGGEDGTLQRELESIALPWVGCSAASSELTFSKSLTRARLQQHGISVPSGTTIGDATFPSSLSLPVVVKPDRQGSSVGVCLVRDESNWSSAIEVALSFGHDAVVETFVDGREMSVAVVYGVPLPVVEIILTGDWYDYEAKYVSDTTKYDINPAGLSEDLQAVAVRACEVCDANGILRVDFRIDSAGRAYALEINTIPGMTDHSLVPKAAAAAGLTLTELCGRCVRHVMDSAR